MDKFQYSDGCVALFAKAPILGKVKTRLARTIGEEQALVIYQQLLERAVTSLDCSNLCRAEVWGDIDVEHPTFEKFRKQYRLPIQQQVGDDLGQKLIHAAKSLFKKERFVIFIGADCPFIDEEYLDKAVRALYEFPVVIGPATDGGYVLIGLSAFDEQVFSGIPWGSEEVLATTIQRVEALGWKFKLLEALSDIDEEKDLALLEKVEGLDLDLVRQG